MIVKTGLGNHFVTHALIPYPLNRMQNQRFCNWLIGCRLALIYIILHSVKVHAMHGNYSYVAAWWSLTCGSVTCRYGSIRGEQDYQNLHTLLVTAVTR